jgi:hypothetical protein
LFTKSTDGGLSFDNLKQVNSDDGLEFSFLNDIAIDQDNINNVYYAYTRPTNTVDIVISKSSNGGVTFENPINVSTGNNRLPSLSTNGNNVYAVWQDFSVNPPDFFTSDIGFAASTDGGLTYSDPINISNNPLLLSTGPSIATDEDNNVFVVWAESLPNGTDPRILFTKSTDGGITFSPPREIANLEESSRQQKVAVSGDNIYTVWDDRNPNDAFSGEIYLLISRDDGDTFDFQNIVNISKTAGRQSISPSIDASGENIGISWSDRMENAGFEIFFSGSTNNGITFTNPINVTLSSQNSNTLSDISLSGNKVYVTWTTLENGFDILFSSGILHHDINDILLKILGLIILLRLV